MSLYPLFFGTVLAGLVLLNLIRGTLDETVGRISRHWIPFLAFFFLCFTVAGYTLNNFGVPSLFRDDAQLYELHGWAAIRNSAVLWSQCFATLLLFAIWGFIYHVEAADQPPGTSPKHGRRTTRYFILANGLPIVLFLLGAAALPRKADSLVAVADLAKGSLGVALALGILWLVTVCGGSLLSVLQRYQLISATRLPARLLDFLSLVLIGPRSTETPAGAVEPGIMARLKQAQATLVQPPAVPTPRRLVVGGVSIFMLMLVATLGLLTVYPILQSSISIVLLLAWLLMFYFLIAFFRPWLRLWLVVAVAAYIAWVNAGPFQHTFLALTSYYEPGEQVRLVPGDAEYASHSPDGLLPPIDTLARWRAGMGDQCEHLVIVDAGYYENYGLAAAASWLFSARDTADADSAIEWLRNRGLGVILIQFRAFPFDSALPAEDSQCHRAGKSETAKPSGHGFQFLTTPLEAISGVRESGMNIRNDQQFDLIKALLAEDRVHAFSFENTTDVGMSWYLTPNEVECLRQEVYSDYNRDQWEKLRLILKEPTDTAGSEPTS